MQYFLFNLFNIKDSYTKNNALKFVLMDSLMTSQITLAQNVTPLVRSVLGNKVPNV